MPIYNVDGHERVSPWNRPNQDGPQPAWASAPPPTGTTSTATSSRLETPEARALVGLVNAWQPHLVVDIHVTDGVDHDWVLTWAGPRRRSSPRRSTLAARPTSRPPGRGRAAGSRFGPYVELVTARPGQGFESRSPRPRYSTGYFPLRHRASILIEMHSHKPYRERVLATGTSSPRCSPGGDGGRCARPSPPPSGADGRRRAPDAAAVDDRRSPSPRRGRTAIRLPDLRMATEPSVVTGGPQMRYRRGAVQRARGALAAPAAVAASAPRPRGYLVLPGWPAIERRLRTTACASRS